MVGIYDYVRAYPIGWIFLYFLEKDLISRVVDGKKTKKNLTTVIKINCSCNVLTAAGIVCIDSIIVFARYTASFLRILTEFEEVGPYLFMVFPLDSFWLKQLVGTVGCCSLCHFLLLFHDRRPIFAVLIPISSLNISKTFVPQISVSL